MKTLYLASQSPRRLQLLEQMTLAPRLLLPDEGEDAEALEAILGAEAPDDYVRRVTLAKWAAAHARWQARHALDPAGWSDGVILCSDTTVALDDEILGKPEDGAHAFSVLSRLQGRWHRVLTAVAVGLGSEGLGKVSLAVSVSEVRFADIPADFLQAYVASGAPMGKAGSYAIQSQLAAWIPEIRGSYSGIMGLPLFETGGLLRAHGFPV